jgi:hypothetical protein
MLYGAIDGTGVKMTAKETAGREGKGEDGRARTHEFKLARVERVTRRRTVAGPVCDLNWGAKDAI